MQKEMIQMETENKQKISSEICRYHKMSLDITRYPKITMQRVIHEIGAFQSDLYFLNCKFQQRCENFYQILFHCSVLVSTLTLVTWKENYTNNFEFASRP